jgi:hypothetical protein
MQRQGTLVVILAKARTSHRIFNRKLQFPEKNATLRHISGHSREGENLSPCKNYYLIWITGHYPLPSGLRTSDIDQN